MTGIIYTSLATLMFDLAHRRSGTTERLFALVAGTVFLIAGVGALVIDIAKSVGIN